MGGSKRLSRPSRSQLGSVLILAGRMGTHTTNLGPTAGFVQCDNSW